MKFVTRIRFNKEDPEIWRSPSFNIGAQVYDLILLPKQLKYEIITNVSSLEIDNYIVKSDFANNVPTLMKKAKTALKELGIKFDDEIRNNGKNEKLKF